MGGVDALMYVPDKIVVDYITNYKKNMIFILKHFFHFYFFYFFYKPPHNLIKKFDCYGEHKVPAQINQSV